ncbi:fimbria/pilus periplasmic chaperone [Erwinia mallotivora]|uniref:fimbria/pilus periplasmic chaperone n=1 Tax=Erwinia mallotivora TaxID=69222 RepID=UPI003B84A4BC
MKWSRSGVIRTSVGFCALMLVVNQSYAAIALDRTRVVFESGNKSVSLTVTNNNQQLPYLAQGWLEDTAGKKIQQPLVVLPPIQRIEAGEKSQVKIQKLPSVANLAQDRETLFYFNLREIPPRSNKANTLQLALQTRIKLFYRPQALVPEKNAVPFQEKLLLNRVGDRYRVKNPGAYYVTLVDARSSVNGESASGFEPLMLAPESEGTLNVSALALGSNPVLTYINDYGGRKKLLFKCSTGSNCKAEAVMPKA